jgi:hypothetical protein
MMDEPTSTTGSANYLLDVVMSKLNCRKDAHLAKKLYTDSPRITKIRTGILPLGATMIINIHEETGMDIADIKLLAGMPKAKPFDREYCNKGQ